MILHLIPEGLVDEMVGVRLIEHSGHQRGVIYNKNKGCAYIQQQAHLFHRLAGEHAGVLVLTDFRDAKHSCIPAALNTFLFSKVPTVHPAFLFRFSVAEIESWLLADRQGMAGFLSIAESHLPIAPDKEPLPKQTLVNLARKSRKTAIHNAMVPQPSHKGSTAPLYTATIGGFIRTTWNIEAARLHSSSLDRCLHRLEELPRDTEAR